MTILIAGAGIAGLTTALTCHQLGLETRLFERVDSIEPLGVGINLQPLAVRELHELGLAEELDAIAVRTREVSYFSKRGLEIWSEPRGTWAGYNWPQYSVHRGHLQMMMLNAVRRRLGSDYVETGCRVTGVTSGNNGVRVQISGRDATERSEEGALLVAADGIHSDIRAQFYPDEGPPVWGGPVLWRATTLARPFLSGATMAMAGHEFQKFVTYPISEPDPETGKALINWIAELKFDPAKDHWNREDYNRHGRLGDFLPAFESWVFDWLDIPALIRGAERIYEFPMVDRDPIPCWTFGRTTLLGDAAHAMYPIGSNGASQGIVDARVLGRELRRHGVGETALQAYEAERRPATSAIVLANRGNGPDQVMQIVEERCGGEFSAIEDILSQAEMTDMAAAYKRLAGFGIETLNAAPPTLDTEQAHA